jgi:hypothetical protein
VVTKTVAVEVPVPVVRPLPDAYTKDCEPRQRYPSTSITVEALVDRAIALELALATCRNQLENIRALQTSAQ